MKDIRSFADERLRYLFESVRLGTMRAASEFLDVAPSSISRQIASLEEELGVTLVEKGRHTVQLTGAGELVLQYYRDRLAQRETLIAAIDDLKALRQGHFSAAVGLGLVRKTLVQAMRDYMAKYPGIAMTVRNVPTREVRNLVRDDYVHFGIVMDAPHENRLRTRATIPQPLCLIAPPGSDLAKRKSITLQDLRGKRLILPDQGFRVRQIIEEVERVEGIFFDVVISTSSIQMIGDLVAANVGMSIMADEGVFDLIEAGRVVSVPLNDPPFRDAKAHIIVRVGRKLPLSVIRLLEILERCSSTARAGRRG